MNATVKKHLVTAVVVLAVMALVYRGPDQLRIAVTGT